MEYAGREPRLIPTHNTYGPGPGPRAALRLRARARPTIIVVTMADGSDDPQQIDDLAHLVERGVVVAAASRYIQGGQQVGGPFLKSLMSRLAGLSLFYIARVGTRDATNSFKAYDRAFVEKVGIESDAGFEMGIELVAKARRHRAARGRDFPPSGSTARLGQSNFKVRAWIPATSAGTATPSARGCPEHERARHLARPASSAATSSQELLGRGPRGGRRRQPLEVRPGRRARTTATRATAWSRATAATST